MDADHPSTGVNLPRRNTLGEDVTEVLEKIPARLKVIRKRSVTTPV